MYALMRQQCISPSDGQEYPVVVNFVVVSFEVTVSLSLVFVMTALIWVVGCSARGDIFYSLDISGGSRVE